MPEDLAQEIIERTTLGESLLSICKNTDYMPTEFAVRMWLAKDDLFASNYARARERGMDRLGDEIIAIADEPPILTPDGKVDHGAEQHRKTRLDARKWVMARQAPKKWGDKIDHKVEASGTITVVTGVPERDSE